MNQLPDEIIDIIINFNDFNTIINFTSTNRDYNIKNIRKKILFRILLQKAYQVGIHDGYIANGSLDISGYYLNDKPLIFEKSYSSWQILSNLSDKIFNVYTSK
jgi:hypothetical protein